MPVAFVIEIPIMQFDDPAAHMAGFGIPAYMVACGVSRHTVFAHQSNERFRASVPRVYLLAARAGVFSGTGDFHAVRALSDRIV